METKRGWLTKQGRVRKSWRRRYFVLKDGALIYYEKESDVVPKGQMSLFGAAVVLVEPPKISKPNCVEVSTPSRSLYIHAESKQEIEEWALSIQRAAVLTSGGQIKTSAFQIKNEEEDWAELEKQEQARKRRVAAAAAKARAAPEKTKDAASSKAKKPASSSSSTGRKVTKADEYSEEEDVEEEVVVPAKEEVKEEEDVFDEEEKEKASKMKKVKFTVSEKSANADRLRAAFTKNEEALSEIQKSVKAKKKSMKKWQNFENVKLRKTLKGHQKFVNVVAKGEDYIVSGGDDSTVRVWNANTFQQMVLLEGHTNVVKSVCCGGKIVASSSDDGSIRVWDRTRKKCIKTFYTSTGLAADGLAMTSDQSVLVSVSDKTLQAWDLDAKKCLLDLQTDHTDRIASVVIYGQTVFTGSADHTIRVWDMTQQSCVATLDEHKNCVFCMVTAGSRLFSGSEDIKVWDVSDAKKGKVKLKTTLADPHKTPSVQSLAVTDDERYIISTSLDAMIKIWELDLKKKSKPKVELENKTKFIFSAVVTGRRIFQADRSGVVKVWE